MNQTNLLSGLFIQFSPQIWISYSNKWYIQQITAAALLFYWPHLLWMINSFETYQINIKLNFIGCDGFFFLSICNVQIFHAIRTRHSKARWFFKYSTKWVFFFFNLKEVLCVCVYLEWSEANDNMNKVRDFEILWCEWLYSFVDNSKSTIFFFRCFLIDFIFCVGTLLNEITCSIGPVPVNIWKKVKIELSLFFYENWMWMKKGHIFCEGRGFTLNWFEVVNY